MGLQLVTPPVAYPLHINAIKQHLRVDIADDDTLISSVYLQDAIQTAFNETQRQLVSARWLLTLDSFCCRINIPLAPLLQVVNIRYMRSDGTLQTMAATDYVATVSGGWTYLTPAAGKSWPATISQRGAVLIILDMGYVSSMGADITANSIRIAGLMPMVTNEVVRFSNSGGVLPAPLQAKTDYFIKDVLGSGAYTLSASAGGAILDLTDLGSGAHFVGKTGINDGNGEIPGSILAWMLMRIETLYSYRGGLVNTPGSVITKNPFIDNLLDPYRLILI